MTTFEANLTCSCIEGTPRNSKTGDQNVFTRKKDLKRKTINFPLLGPEHF